MKTGERLPAHLKRMLGALPATGQSGTDQSGTDLPMPGKQTKAKLPVTGSPVSVTDMLPVPVTGVPLPETGIACKRKLTIKSSDESEKEILAMYGVGPLSSSSSSSRIAPMQTTAAVEISSSEDVSPVKKRGGSPACDRPV